MIAENFKPINMDAREEICGFLNENKSISCETCFGNLFSWSSAEKIEYFIDNQENILYLRNNLNDNAKYYFPISKNPEKAVENLLDFEKNPEFINLLKEQAEFLGSRFDYKIIERRDRSEYIYEAEKLRTFPGKKLYDKKYQMNKFHSMYGDRYKFEKIDKNNIYECLHFSWEWRNVKGYGSDKSDESILEEFYVIKNFADNYEELGLFGGCIKIDGKIKAFTICERPFDGSDCVVVHIEKGEYRDIAGIYVAICSMFLTAHPEFKFVNREDDMGIEGLRQSKLSYRPAYLLERFDAIKSEEND